MLAALHPIDFPHVWRAQEMARANTPVLPTGFAALDAQLPGGGWPSAGLVELLQGQGAGRTGQHDFQLLLPALASLLAQRAGPLVLVGGPVLGAVVGGSVTRHLRGAVQWPAHALLEPFMPALAAQGLPPERLLRVQAATPAGLLWACEQALRCADVPAVLAWLPRVLPEALRRLHVGAMEHSKPLWVLRPESARQASSAAPLRLLLSGALEGGVDRLQVQVLKRRGPPLEQALQLDAHPARLKALLAARRRSQPAAPFAVPPRLPTPRAQPKGGVHALDRLVVA